MCSALVVVARVDFLGMYSILATTTITCAIAIHLFSTTSMG